MGRTVDSWWWRLAAWAALALLALAGLTGLLLILSHPGLALAYVVTAALALGAGWRLLFTRRRGKAWFYGLALLVLLVLMAVETWEFLQQQHHLGAVVLMLVLLVSGLGLAAALRRRYLDDKAGRRLQAVGGRPFLIVNPKSGAGRAIKAQIPGLAARLGIKVLMLEKGSSLTGLVQRAVDEGATILGISGGDGSIGVAAAAAMEHDLPLVVLPGGTRCHFARDIGLDPEQIADSLRSFQGREVRIDAGEVNGRVFVNNASFGMYADIVSQPDYRRRKLQSALQVLQGLAEEKGGYPLQFQDQAGRRHRKAVAVLVGVNRYETVKLAELGVRRRLDEGVLQMTVLYRLEPSLLKQLAGAVKISEYAAERPGDMAQWTGDRFEVAGGGGTLWAGIDGELVELASPVRLRILPGQLRLMVPPEGLQPRKNALTRWQGLKSMALKGRLPDA